MINDQVKPNQIIHIKLDFLRAIVARLDRLLFLAVIAQSLNFLFASAIADEKLIRVRAVCESWLLEKQHSNHSRKEK